MPRSREALVWIALAVVCSLVLFGLYSVMQQTDYSLLGIGNRGDWLPHRDDYSGITAKQGYSRALDLVIRTYSGTLNGTYLLSVRGGGGDITKAGRATHWRYSFC